MTDVLSLDDLLEVRRAGRLADKIQRHADLVQEARMSPHASIRSHCEQRFRDLFGVATDHFEDLVQALRELPQSRRRARDVLQQFHTQSKSTSPWPDGSFPVGSEVEGL